MAKRSPTSTLSTAHSVLSFEPDPRPWHTRSIAYQYTPFRGMYHDVRRRLPFYLSDWTQAFHHPERVVGSTVKMYFLNLFPALAYTLDMHHRTGGSYGVNETLLSTAVAALTFSLLSVQPLTIVGVTGLTNLFNYTTYNILKDYDVDYLQFQAWALIWSAIMHWIVAAFNLCDYTRFITDMTSETFGLYVGIIYIQKGIELLNLEFAASITAGWFGVVLAILFALTVYHLEHAASLPFASFRIRRYLQDYTFAAAIVFFTGFVHIPGQIKVTDAQKVPVTQAFQPSTDRSWVIHFWDLPGKWIGVAVPFGMLITLLFYFDNNVSSVAAQARGYPIKRPAGFHWDFFLLGCTTFVSGLIGLPAPNGLVPQAPENTESLCEKTVVEEADFDDAKGFKPHDNIEGDHVSHENQFASYKVVTSFVVEQRLSHFVMGALTLATMTRPFLVCLSLMSRAMFSGIFIVIGWASVQGSGVVHKTLYLLRDPRFTPRDHPLLKVPKASITKYIFVQWLFLAMILAISETIAGIGFPVIITLLIPLRHLYLNKWIPQKDLDRLDAPTANSDAVLVSLGGPLKKESNLQD